MYKLILASAAALCLTASACRESFYEDQELEPVAAANVNSDITGDRPQVGLSDEAGTLNFDLLMSPCIVQGTTIAVSFRDERDRNERFEITWYAYNRIIGTGEQIDCVCADVVSAVVVRLSDGARGVRSIEPYPCEDREN